MRSGNGNRESGEYEDGDFNPKRDRPSSNISSTIAIGNTKGTLFSIFSHHIDQILVLRFRSIQLTSPTLVVLVALSNLILVSSGRLAATILIVPPCIGLERLVFESFFGILQ